MDQVIWCLADWEEFTDHMALSWVLVQALLGPAGVIMPGRSQSKTS